MLPLSALASYRAADTSRRRWLRTGLALPAVALSGCALLAPRDEDDAREAAPIVTEDLSGSDWARASALAGHDIRWQHLRFRGRKPTHYEPQWHAGRSALYAVSHRGSSVLRHALRRPAHLTSRLAFSWWVDELPPGLDVRARETDDAVARVIVTFDAERSRFTARDAMLSELALLVTGEPLPAATIEYLWDANLPAGTVLTSSYSTRVRYIVAESGPQRLSRWVDIERDLQADFARAFNEPPATVTGVGLMTDANDTLGQAQAWYGPMQWVV